MLSAILQEIAEPKTWLESRVYQLLRHLGMNQPEQIDLHRLCTQFDIDILEIAGRSRTHAHPKAPERYIIAVDERLEPVERRVKIAHELGHLLLHVGIQPHSNEWMIDWQESQANHFAEHLLLPLFMVSPLLAECDRYHAPAYLAQRFQVPLSLARIRFDRILARLHAKGFPVY
ncbi:ImmA/IrrE family metallo-endopeptidase [Brevibacillus choshinensis]|uniref:ImmA/IrrE family metallo-endopeptidase n=1 Tax=Brevibacillus choshinensis TaxID=54911 RepID=A0ABX7FR34_BRECH|nr:ImmA/IrrE family metallo-endopeptidase [Brevibacillus choshinensis]QRG68701.1 ImmA/IrrE family metallo-endopeptidase [Brevibacillus choshinensis]